ncbi:hypothetical protein [Maribacter halichondriae]|uniref:hypothetical protein n=1 Tax=Maribacter halichondriae TaxID=2980554 RepID=UPI003076560B
MTKLFWGIVCILATSALFGQTQPRSFTVKFISEPIVADGILDEPIWQTAESANDYWQYFPTDSVRAGQQSEVKILYDDKNIYIGVKANSVGQNYALTSLKGILGERATTVSRSCSIPIAMDKMLFYLASTPMVCVERD